MKEPADAEGLVARLRPWLREEYAGWFEAGLAWGWPRCRTDEERLLYPCLLVVLSPFNAVVAHRRLTKGELAAFQISVGRKTRAGPDRHSFIVCSAPEAVQTEEGRIYLPADLVLRDPWEAASRVASQIRDGIMGAES